MKLKELLDHAQNLLEQAKVFVTKPVKEKHRAQPKPLNRGKKATWQKPSQLYMITLSITWLHYMWERMVALKL